jgi:hypothetical protein
LRCLPNLKNSHKFWNASSASQVKQPYMVTHAACVRMSPLITFEFKLNSIGDYAIGVDPNPKLFKIIN